MYNIDAKDGRKIYIHVISLAPDSIEINRYKMNDSKQKGKTGEPHWCINPFTKCKRFPTQSLNK